MAKLITFIIIGLILCGIGIMNIKGNISSIHWYNRTRVTEDDAPKYGKAVGTGTLIIGLSIMLSGLLEYVFESTVFGFSVIAGVLIGIGFMLYGQFKYNKGIF